MKKTDLPARKPVPFGANGSRRDLTAKTPTGSNQASYDAGFPPITMTIKAAGGLPPDGRDMNQALNELYTGYRWHNAGAGYPFDADFATAIGGYPAGAKVPNSTNDGFWLNTIDGNTTNPEVLDASATGWVPVNSYGITSITGLETGTITLTTLQAAKEELVFSGNLIADTTVIFPPWIRNWTVTNHCQGNFTLTCKPLSGTGVVLPSGRNVIRCDGSQIIFAILVASLTQHGLTRLSSATDSNDETLAATPKAVKAAYDLAKTVSIDGIYPVGIVVWFAQNKNPNTLFPNTKWQYIGENKTIRLAKADGSNVFTTGGADAIKLTEAQLPAHGHTFSATTSSYDYGSKQTNTTGQHYHVYAGVAGDSWNARGGDGSNNQWKYATKNTNPAGNHAHTVTLGPHSHNVSGTTGKTGSGSEIDITNSFITLMGWYRIS
ncbi:tail fiber protein [Candidatus Arsenophonus triatominarum]|uniref:tail fiber protein n=1 Tax=Candidatus Arsenophonus triatominarum TaxID=57911 RepID=UPI00094128D6|nr:tail fiber protein [Candidatus Arsenophonus triatominarum]